jgi:hypothetical protein
MKNVCGLSVTNIRFTPATDTRVSTRDGLAIVEVANVPYFVTGLTGHNLTADYPITAVGVEVEDSELYSELALYIEYGKKNAVLNRYILAEEIGS